MGKKKTKFTVKDAEKAALQHERAHLDEKESKQVKEKCKKKLHEVLDSLGTDVIDVDKKSQKVLRVQRIISKTINYDKKKLMKLIDKRSKKHNKNLKKKAFKLEIDKEGIEDLYNNGYITYDELNKCVDEIKESTSLRVNRVEKEE